MSAAAAPRARQSGGSPRGARSAPGTRTFATTYGSFLGEGQGERRRHELLDGVALPWPDPPPQQQRSTGAGSEATGAIAAGFASSGPPQGGRPRKPGGALADPCGGLLRLGELHRRPLHPVAPPTAGAEGRGHTPRSGFCCARSPQGGDAALDAGALLGGGWNGVWRRPDP
ncbi:unnamed protein product [Prorocentrum cordatum]|uniref:Uncharacterized protein n=1 Tax=Prorocentrum cordatum TaxID=2364126 RepID=A0ABN9VGT7_9DINO|nr:unnamed protein product [Polarella glacialis]